MFQFRGLASVAGCQVFYLTGCPIQKSPDQFLFADPRSLSQLTTSFFASKSLGIPHAPLSYFLTTLTLRCVRLYLISLIMSMNVANLRLPGTVLGLNLRPRRYRCNVSLKRAAKQYFFETWLQKGGVPAAPSGTATLLRLSPSHRFCPRSLLAVTNFKHPQLPWLDGRCVQGPGTYSPRHG